MNTGLIQTLLESVQVIQASVKAIEAKLDNPSSMVAASPIKVPEIWLEAVELPTADEVIKHPLEDYKITEEDVGSLVVLWDDGDTVMEPQVSRLVKVGKTSDPYIDQRGHSWDNAKPHLDPVALHFIPFHATDEDIPPSDLKDGEWYAVLFVDGSVHCTDYLEYGYWSKCEEGIPHPTIIGYRPLSFVNPILENESSTQEK